MSDPPRGSLPSRRAVIGGLGVGTAVAWSAPVLLSVDAARAATLAPFAPVTLAGSSLAWVAQGSSGAVWTSGDEGENWEQRSSPGFVGSALAATGSFWVASNGASFAISNDYATSWGPAAAPPGSPSATIFGEDPTVALDPTGALWRTADLGATWSAPASPPQLTMLTGAQLGYLGYESVSDLWFYSANAGLTWTGTTTPPIAVPNLIVGGGTCFVVVGPSDMVVSTDGGSTFVPVLVGPGFVPVLVAGSAGAFVAMSATGQWATSPTGLTWTASAGPGWVASLLAGYGGQVFVATDGSSWSRTTDGGTTWEAPATPPG